MDITKETFETKGHDGNIRSPKPASEIVEKIKAQDVPSIRLSPEQIEEIHSDEYSLTLFYATRVEPLTTLDIKKQFPEPEVKKAQAVMDRFLKVGLIHLTIDGKYYSNFPENYINYSDYRYDSDLEAKKDSKVFRLMKAFTGNKEYWKNKTYFSMDAFYTEEQTKEIQAMFLAIKNKSKEYANENAKKKSVKGLFFRRMKFFDMTLSILLAMFLSLGSVSPANAGGNDPTFKLAAYQDWISYYAMIMRSGGGNDPTAMALRSTPARNQYVTAVNTQSTDNNSEGGFGSIQMVSSAEATSRSQTKVVIPEDNNPETDDGGGGHDPTTCKPIVTGGGGHDPGDREAKPGCCVPSPTGELIPVYSPKLCKAQSLLIELMLCQKAAGACSNIEKELYEILFQNEKPTR